MLAILGAPAPAGAQVAADARRGASRDSSLAQTAADSLRRAAVTGRRCEALTQLAAGTAAGAAVGLMGGLAFGLAWSVATRRPPNESSAGSILKVATLAGVGLGLISAVDCKLDGGAWGYPRARAP